MLGVIARTVGLILGRRLHLHNTRVGRRIELPDGRAFVVFRESSCDQPEGESSVMLAVWFHLRGVPPGAHIRRAIFERESILNTVLFAGFPGYLVKLWMIDPETGDYAGLYSWTAAEARRYGEYITGILRPLSTPGSVGFRVYEDRTLEGYLASTGGTS